MTPMTPMTPMRSLLTPLVAITALAGTLSACSLVASTTPEVPTTQVVRGDLAADVHTSGEFTARRSILVTAPAVPGALRLVTLVASGTMVRADEVVMRFDPSEQQFNLDQAESQVAEADQEIAKQAADRDVRGASDEVNLLKARFDVRRAELDVTTNELLSAVDARKNELTLEEARRKLAQLEEDVRSRAETDKAALTVLQEKRQKAMFARDVARRAIAQMEVRAPFDGLIAVRQNQDAGGGMYYPGMTLPDYREGDVVFAGRPVLTVLDPAELELRTRVPEVLATSVSQGQRAEVQLDGSTRAPLEAVVASVSGMADRGGSSRSPTGQREFDVMLRLTRAVTDVEPGRTARIRIAGAPLTQVLSLPRQSVFDRGGTPTVFVREGARFSALPVTVMARTQTRVVVDGIAEGTAVALVDPERIDDAPAAPAAAPTAAAGGGAPR
jgi:HlyD family secretion protein